MNPNNKRRGRPPGTHPPKRYTDRVDIYVTPEMKAWIAANGGSAYLREVVYRDVEASLSVYSDGASTEDEIASLQRILDAEKEGK